jgi:hypothetical protein
VLSKWTLRRCRGSQIVPPSYSAFATSIAAIRATEALRRAQTVQADIGVRTDWPLLISSHIAGNVTDSVLPLHLKRQPLLEALPCHERFGFHLHHDCALIDAPEAGRTADEAW